MNSIRDYKHAVSVYLTNCKADGLSACTLENYRSHLEGFGNFCEQNGGEISPEMVLDWKVLLHDSGLKNSSIATYMRDVRLFVNTMNKAVKVMQLAGVKANTKRVEHEGYVDYIVSIPV